MLDVQTSWYRMLPDFFRAGPGKAADVGDVGLTGAAGDTGEVGDRG